MEYRKSKYKYIYNLKQASFFASEGADVVKTDININTGKTFVQFINNEKLQKLYDIWVNRKH